MALMIPESIPANASQGEQTLYNILRDRLPDDFYVWYEPIVNGKYPDFIIIRTQLWVANFGGKGLVCWEN